MGGARMPGSGRETGVSEGHARVRAGRRRESSLGVRMIRF